MPPPLQPSDATLAEPASGLSVAEQAGERAVKNTLVRSGGEVVGKVASFVLFAALARALGQSELGVFVLALAFVQVATMPVGLGLDRYMLRRIAGDRPALGGYLYNVLGLKLALSVPAAVATAVLVNVLGYDAHTRLVVYVLTLGVLLELLARTLLGVFEAFERGGLLAVSLIVQRVLAAGLGLAALAAGLGVVTIALTYTTAAAAALVLTGLLFARRIGFPRPSLDRSGWGGLARSSLPFAVQDVFGVLLFRIDTVILSLMATEAAVGRYGAAYRLFEATLLFTWALTGSFVAMFVYLDERSEPTLRAAFQRSIKVALAVLTPCAVALGVLAEPVCRVLFGGEFAAAAAPLRALAPVIVLIGIVSLSSSLIVSRGRPTLMVGLTAAMASLNIVLNVALIPSLADTGAALAMLATEAAFAAMVLTVGARLVGGLEWTPMVVSPLLAGGLMAVPIVLLASWPLAAAGAGVAIYVAAFVALERAVSPLDLEFMVAMAKRRLPSRAGA
ncbi:MAG: oligosaccharide flippase family protein [Thermoleophilaceae bacterium]